jgi:NAD+ synthase
MNTSLSLVLHQANPVVGDIAGNAARMLAARREHPSADLVVFPECFLSGYPLEDLALRAGFVSRVTAEIHRLCDALRREPGPALLFGAPVPGAELPFNAGVLIRRDGTLSMALKSELPNSDVFDEMRIFQRGGDPRVLHLDGFRLGVMICEDMWHGRAARALAGELADMLIVLNGSPFEPGKHETRLAHARRAVRETGLPLAYLNQVGGQDEMVFDGASFALDGDGTEIAQLPFGAEAALCLTLSRGGAGNVLDWERPEDEGLHLLPHTPYPAGPGLLYGACVLGLADYIRKIGNPPVLIGVSGGLDSALVAALAVDALGAERVTGVMLPSPHTSRESLELAEDLMTRLGIRRLTLPIAGALAGAAVFSEAARPASPRHLGLALENIQARMRGLALMTLANAEGAVLLSTGNKSEMSVGYATLYGDMNGGFNPLKDLYKTEVRAAAAWRNAAAAIPGREGPVMRNPIPQGILSRTPTAELRPDQSDEAELGPYEELDALLRGLIEGNLDSEAARRAAEAALGRDIPSERASRIARLLRAAEFKRRQAAPGIKLSSRSFGKGWRYPIAGAGDFESGEARS